MKVWTVKGRFADRHAKEGLYSTHTLCGKRAHVTFVESKWPVEAVTCEKCQNALKAGLAKPVLS